MKDNCFWEEEVKKYEKTQTQSSAISFHWKLQELLTSHRQKEHCFHNHTNLTNVTNPNNP